MKHVCRGVADGAGSEGGDQGGRGDMMSWGRCLDAGKTTLLFLSSCTAAMADSALEVKREKLKQTLARRLMVYSSGRSLMPGRESKGVVQGSWGVPGGRSSFSCRSTHLFIIQGTHVSYTPCQIAHAFPDHRGVYKANVPAVMALKHRLLLGGHTGWIF